MVHGGTISLAKDDNATRRILTKILTDENFTVYEASLGKRLLEILEQYQIELILLDMHLPDTNVLDLIQSIRQRTDIPIIIIGDPNSKSKSISSLYLGADNHIHDPLNADELIAHLIAALRRYRGDFSVASKRGAAQETTQRISFAKWVLNREKLQIFHSDNQSGGLTAHEYRLLEILVSNAGRAFRRSDLCEAIRVDNYVPTPRSIDLKVMRLRKKIGDDAINPRYIITIRGFGYMFSEEALHQK